MEDAARMPRIIVVAETPSDPAGAVLYQERVGTPLIESPYARAQLMERLGWAVSDAEQAERSAISPIGAAQAGL